MKIEKYEKKRTVTGGDYVIATVAGDMNRTRNLAISELSKVVLGQLKSTGLLLNFSDGVDESIGDYGYFFTNQNKTDKSTITEFYFSSKTTGGDDVAELFDTVAANLGEMYVSITNQKDVADFGFFNVLTCQKIDEYYKVTTEVRGSLYAKPLIAGETYSLMFDLASSELSMDVTGNILSLYKNGVLIDQEDISVNTAGLDRARLNSGTVTTGGIATFFREDESSFNVDFSGMMSGMIPTKTSDLTNDGDGTNPFVTDAYTTTEVDSLIETVQNAVNQNGTDIEVLQGITLTLDENTGQFLLKDGNSAILSQGSIEFLNNEAVKIWYDQAGKTIQLLDKDNNVIDYMAVASFLVDVATNIRFNGANAPKLELIGYTGDPIGSVFIEIANVDQLQAALDAKEDHLGYPAQDGYVLHSKADGTREWKENDSDKHYYHDQPTPAMVWNIPHGLNKEPSITARDSTKREIEGEVEHVDKNNSTITYNTAISGSATCN